MLQKSTAKLWQALSSKSELAGFVLIGGSALALHIHHRISEDLDFAWPYGRLPRESLQTLIEGEPSLDYVLDQNEVALREAEDANLDLADFAQNYLVNGVRVTFFSSYQAERRLLARQPNEPLRIAAIPEIFALKALASADRSKSRDWFDLYTLFKHHRFTWQDFYEVFSRYSTIDQYRNAANRLCSGQPQANDEGFETLVSHAPSLEEMSEYFQELRRQSSLP
jgi:predicted nucleotidyltransferase component of viral defense system